MDASGLVEEEEIAEAPKKSMARPGSEMGLKSQVIRMLEGKISGHQKVKWSSKLPEEDSSTAPPSFDSEDVVLTGPSAIQVATSDAVFRALR